MMDYLPLPKFLTIKESKVHGLGLFSKDKISRNKSLGMTHMIINGLIFRTPLGGFYNHSEEPNCIKYEKKHSNESDFLNTYYYLKAIRDIKRGEELTVKYTLYNITKEET